MKSFSSSFQQRVSAGYLFSATHTMPKKRRKRYARMYSAKPGGPSTFSVRNVCAAFTLRSWSSVKRDGSRLPGRIESHAGFLFAIGPAIAGGAAGFHRQA